MRIAVFQVYDERLLEFANRDDEGKHCLLLTEVVNYYCKKHNYTHLLHYVSENFKKSADFLKHITNPLTDKPIADLGQIQHTKFYALGEVLTLLENNEYDYVCMIDVDMGVYDFNKSILDYLNLLNASDKSLVAGAECISAKLMFDGRQPNGGVYLFKNTQWTKRFLKGMINAIQLIGYSAFRLSDCCMDQMQFAFAAMVCPDCDREMLITDGFQNIQHRYFPMYYPELGKFNENHLFIHFAGKHKAAIVKYLEIIKNMDNNINIDNYLKSHELSIKHL